MKMVALKPLVWNGNNYLNPVGIETRTGFVGKYGYGHEEWNGNPNRIWRGSRIFHTEGRGKLLDFGGRGELGIIMTAYRGGKPHAVGVATSVRLNSEAEMQDIFKELDLDKESERLWRLASVKKRFSSHSAFKKHWRDQGYWNRWRAPEDQYTWFEVPILIDPDAIFPSESNKPREAIVKMFNGFMPVRPDQALAIVGSALDEDSPSRKWLKSQDFDATVVSKKTASRSKPKSSTQPSKNGAPAVSEAFIRYLKACEIHVTPRHHDLDRRFRSYLVKQRAGDIILNKACVDLRYRDLTLGHVLVEIKPCDPGDARFAIRTAIGQLLDYRQRDGADPKMLIVIEARPSAEDIALATANGFGIAFPIDETEGFQIRWA